MSYYKGTVGASMIIERPKKKNKKLRNNERWGSANCKCPQCKNSVKKYTKIIDGVSYCLRCFINHNKKVVMV
jgi:hypothetical protein